MPFDFWKSSAQRAEEARTLAVQREADERSAMAKARKAEADADAARQRNRKTEFALSIADRASQMGPEGLALAIQIVTGEKMRTPATGRNSDAGSGGGGMDGEMRTFFWDVLREQRSRDPLAEYERFATMDERMRQRYGGTVVEAPDTDDRLVQLANSAAGVKLVEVGGPAVITLLERLAAGIAQQPIDQPRPVASITEVGEAGVQAGGLPDPRKPLSTNEVIDLLERHTPETMAGLFVQRAQHDETLRGLLQLLLETPDGEIQAAIKGWLAKNPAWTPVLRWLMAHDPQRVALVAEVKRLVYAAGAPATPATPPAPASTNGHAPPAAALRNF